MSYLSFLFRRPRSRRTQSATQWIETLESRYLLSAGPSLTNVQLTGSVSNVTGLVLTFDESLNTATAQNSKAFLFGKPAPASSNNGFNLGDLLPFLGRPKIRKVIAGKIQFSSVTYDDASHSVSLTPVAPFRAQRFMRVLRVKGTGPNAVTDPAGNPLNGGADTVIRWSYHNGKQVRYIDNDGDRVTLSLRGRGTIYTFIRKSGDPDPTIFIDRGNPSSVLTASIRKGPHGDGTANIAEVEGAASVQNNLLGNPAFHIQGTQP